MLGQYYLINGNKRQAYISYVQAKFYCSDISENVAYQTKINELKEQGVSVSKTAIVILSWNLKNYTALCIDSIRKTTPEELREIIVVDNASTDDSIEWLQSQPDIILQINKENHGFPKGCNEGIALASKDSDIFLLNNDTVLPPNALFWLQIGLYESESVGATGSISNYGKNDQMIEMDFTSQTEVLDYAIKTNIPMEHPYEPKVYLYGFALLMKRTVLDKVGLLDERFFPGNAEDLDICLRIRKAGYDIILCHNSVIFHFGSQSLKKAGDEYKELMLNNNYKLCDKYGVNINYYCMPRKDLVDYIEAERDSSIRVLELGCGAGATLAWIKGLYSNAELHGVEIVSTVARIADSIQGAHILCGNAETIEFPYNDNYFDYCIMGDILEHLHEPLPVLKRINQLIKPHGKIIVSMPNIKHWSVMIPLLFKDRFSYEDAGILDRTHLRMYTGTEIKKLIKGAGFRYLSSKPTNIGHCPKELLPIVHALESFDRADTKDAYEAYQYIVVAEKEPIKTDLDESKICFITAVNDDEMYDQCLWHIQHLDIPNGMTIDTIVIKEADSMTQAYNAAMNDSDAKYKIYLHQDVMITDELFIEKVINLFRNNTKIGICGVVGANNLPQNGIWWEGRKRGVFLDSHDRDEIMREYKYECDPLHPISVDVLDGVILCTQYDIPWREDLFTKWHFYDLSQCFEFKRRNFEVAVIPSESSMIEHHSGVASMENFDDERKVFIDEYL